MVQVLKVREDHVRSVLDEARRHLGEVTKDSTKYTKVLLSLITQALYQIMEPRATIRCREVDAGLIEQLLPKALQDYKDKSGKEVAVTLDKENYLPVDTCGGVELLALNGRLRVSILLNFFSSSSFQNCTFCEILIAFNFDSMKIGAKHIGITLGINFAAIGARSSYCIVRSQCKP